MNPSRRTQNPDSMETLLNNWQIGAVEKVEPIESYWGKTRLITAGDGTNYILKEKGDIHKGEREFLLLTQLSQMGAPVPMPLLTRDSTWFARQGDRIFCLYPRLPGEVFTDHYRANALARALSLGRALGDLHTYLLKVNPLVPFRELHLVDHIGNWALPRIFEGIDPAERSVIEDTWSAIEDEIGPLYDQLPKHIIHRDPNPANFLFQDGRLTGILDFEMAVRGPRIFDPCYCGTSILVSGYPDAIKMQRWPDLFRELIKGYQETHPLTPDEKSSLFSILVMIELQFAAFSLEIGAIEAAQCNLNLVTWLGKNRNQLNKKFPRN
jgi:Ser/Thr protein kinase RdoA (MazF antagonist)